MKSSRVTDYGWGVYAPRLCLVTGLPSADASVTDFQGSCSMHLMACDGTYRTKPILKNGPFNSHWWKAGLILVTYSGQPLRCCHITKSPWQLVPQSTSTLSMDEKWSASTCWAGHGCRGCWLGLDITRRGGGGVQWVGFIMFQMRNYWNIE